MNTVSIELPQLFEFLRESFNTKSEQNPGFRASVQGFDRVIAFSVSDDSNYWFAIRNARVPAIEEGTPMNANIKILTSRDNLINLLSGKLDPVKAMLSGQLKINGTVTDVAFMKKFLDNNKREIAGLIEQAGY